MRDVLAVILAGGKGSRLEPLTRDRAKPAVPFGGAYRIIDFTLSNCLNSGVRKNLVLTQYKAMSLDRHINLGWQSYLCRELGEFIEAIDRDFDDLKHRRCLHRAQRSGMCRHRAGTGHESRSQPWGTPEMKKPGTKAGLRGENGASGRDQDFERAEKLRDTRPDVSVVRRSGACPRPRDC